MTETLVEVRCRGCRRLIGKGHGHPQQKLFCSDFCSSDFPAYDNTERDDVLEYLARQRGWNATKIHMALGFSRQRAQQILSERGLVGT